MRTHDLIGFDGQLTFIKDFVTEITFSLRHRKNMMKRMHVCNVEIQIEETLHLLKAKAVIKENI